jgi:putative membrane protein
MADLVEVLRAIPNFVRYVAVGFALAALFLWVYDLVTPWREYALIRAGNSAAAIALVGALLGFSLPLANTIRQLADLTDVVLWSLVALAVQTIVHIALRFIFPDLKRAIEANEPSAGIVAGGFSVCFGLINAACLTG